jgi:hypothetical protein
MLRRGAPNSPERGGCTVNSSAPIIMRAMASGLRSLTCLPGKLAAAQDRDLVGECHHLAEFVGDHQDGEIAAGDHAAQHAEHFVGFARREHRGRLVENEKAPAQIQLLEDFALLPLASGNGRDLGIERHAKRHAGEKLLQCLALACPIDHRRHMVARQHEILGDRHRRHEREVLIDHAQPERVRGSRIADHLLPVIDQKLAVIGLVITHDAFDESRFAGPVFAQERMERARTHLQRHGVERDELAETFDDIERFDAEGLLVGGRRRQAAGRNEGCDLAHAMASMNFAAFDTVPNTPPCILIILMAWS